MEIYVNFEDGIEGSPPSAEWLRLVVERALTAERAGGDSEVSLLVAGDETVHVLNHKYLGEDRTTDVLSFPMAPSENEENGFISPPDGIQHLGEIIISYPQTVAQAVEHGHSAEREVAILVVHGVLHLLGYDHDGPEAEIRMKTREKEILDTIPIA